MAKASKIVNCKTCGKEISASAAVCPSCGAKNKKPIYKKWWFWLIIIIIIGLLFSSGSSDSSSSSAASSSQASASIKEEPNATPVPIEYICYTVDEMVDDLSGNALKASDKYKNQYVEITGTLYNIDSNGKYISLSPENNPYAFQGVQCYIKNSDQKSAVMEMSIGDTVTLRGKIIDVGEVLGYSLNIDYIG